MSGVDASRIEALARRVRWLDRYRRLIAVGCAVALAPLIMARLTGFLGSDWPQVHAIALTVLGSVGAWWVVEVWLAWITALWETEYLRLARDRTLPRATLVRRRR